MRKIIEVERDELADMLPLGYKPPRDFYNNVFEAADAIMSSEWMARHDARVAAEAIEAAAVAVLTAQPLLVGSWLRSRAEEYRKFS